MKTYYAAGYRAGWADGSSGFKALESLRVLQDKLPGFAVGYGDGWVDARRNSNPEQIRQTTLERVA